MRKKDIYLVKNDVMERAVTLSTGLSARYVNSYHQNNSLLFQFILTEFIEAFTEIQKIDSLIKGRACSAEDRQKINAHQLIKQSLYTLLGSPKDFKRLCSWNFKDGTILKLKTYCTLFLQNAESDEKEQIALQHYADKIGINCQMTLDSLTETPYDSVSFLSASEKMISAIQRFAKLTTRLIFQFRDDENVMFYILCNHKILDKFYGNRFVIKLFSKIYSKGLKEAQYLLIKKYSERGFDHFLPQIYTACMQLEDSST